MQLENDFKVPVKEEDTDIKALEGRRMKRQRKLIDRENEKIEKEKIEKENVESG